MATPYLRNYYAGGGTSTTLANAMGEYDGSFVITADTGWPGGAGFFTVVIDRGTSSEEKVRCASNSGTTVTVASDGNGGRGYDGTSATGHNAGATVSLCGTSVDFDQANQVVTQVLGQSGAAKGDILAMLSAAGPNTLTRVPVGSNGSQWLGAAAGLPAYGIAPLTTTGDILYASSSSAGSRLAIGTAGQVLGIASGLPAWQQPRPSTTLSSGQSLAINQSYKISGGSGTYVLPVPVAGGFVIVTNYGTGIPVVSHNASEVIWGLGLGSSGSSSFSLGTYGATATVESDGTSWYITAGNADSGWLDQTANLLNTYTAGATAPAIREIGNLVMYRGSIVGGASSADARVFALSSAFQPSTEWQGLLDAGSSNAGYATVSAGLTTVGANATTYWLSPISYTVD